MVKSWVVVAAIVCALPVTARADTKAWTAAKAAVPADAKVIVGLDVAALAKTELWKALYTRLSAELHLDRITTACQLDPQRVVQSVVVATDAEQKAGAVYLAVAGLDQAKIVSCLQRGAKAFDKDAKVVVTKTGNLVEVSDGDVTAFYGWLGTNVLVVAIDPTDKALLQTWMGGNGAFARSDLGALVGKLKTSASVWLASVAVQQIPGAAVKQAYGALTFAGGMVGADVHAGMTDPKAATELSAMVNSQVEQAKKAPQLPVPVSALLKQLSVAAAGDEVVVKANVAEADLVALLAMVLKP